MVFLLPAFLFMFTIIQFQFAFGQEWDPPVELVATGSRCEYPVICSSDNTVHVAWADFRMGSSNPQIYYKRSEDNGMTWSPGIRLSHPDNIKCNMPDMAVSGNNVYIVWEQTESGSAASKLSYCMSWDGGTTFNDPWMPGSSFYNEVTMLEIESFATEVYITGEFTDALYSSGVAIWYSMDGGATFTGPAALSDPTRQSSVPSIAVSGSHIYAAWMDIQASPATDEIYMTQSFDFANNWDPVIPFLNTHINYAWCNIDARDENCYIVWEDGRNGSSQIYFMSSFDDGNTWNPEIWLSESTSIEQYFPEIAIDEDLIHIVWYDEHESDVKYRQSHNKGNDWEPVQDLNDGQDSFFPDISASNGNTFVVYINTEASASGGDVYFRRSMHDFSVDENHSQKNSPELMQNQPNPFNETTSIRFHLPFDGLIELTVYNAEGKALEIITEDVFPAGEHEVAWNGGHYVPGIYYCQIRTTSGGRETSSNTIKMIKY